MKILIIEDEQHNSRLLNGMLKKARPDWEITAILESVKSSISWLQTNPMPDLIFMDIQLTDGICFSIFEKVEVESLIIFTTAYDEYAIQAFKVNSVDYLLKPIKEEKLENAIMKFEKLIKLSDKSVLPDYKELIDTIRTKEKSYKKRFLISGATSYFKIDVEKIAYFYTENRVSFAVTFDGKEHVLDLTMEKIVEQIDPEKFFRANRSIILNSESVLKFENYFGGKLIVTLLHPLKQTITISRLKATEFKSWLDS